MCTYISSRISAHLVFPLFPENQKYIPNSFSGKTLFKIVTFQILNFIPYGVMLNFICFFVLFIAVKKDSKLTFHHMGKILLFNYQDKI